jgi:hypothetical protein
VEKGLDSFVSHKPALPNLDEIKSDGLDSFFQEQQKRRLLAEHLIANYNAGRSTTLYCTACALLPRRTIVKIEKSLAKGSADGKDQKAVAKGMRRLLEEAATDLGIDLALRRKRT